MTVEFFTKGQMIEGVRNFPPSSARLGKWGRAKLRNKAELPRVMEAVKKSHQLMKRAIRNNERTTGPAEGWDI
jgi:hypothetical protein